MDPHRLAERRSRAYHRVVAERLRDDPTPLERARARVAEWLRAPSPAHHAERWAAILAGEPDAVAAFLTSTGEEADELRQSSPFAGTLTARERWALWRAVGEEVGGS